MGSGWIDDRGVVVMMGRTLKTTCAKRDMPRQNGGGANLTSRQIELIQAVEKYGRPSEAAAVLGCSRQEIYSAMSRARRHGIKLNGYKPGPTAGSKTRAETRSRRVTIPSEQAHVYYTEALRRGYSGPAALAGRVLEVVCRDRLFDAILTEDNQ